MNKQIHKVLRYILIYGFYRTLTKVVGRIRPKLKIWIILQFPWYSRKGKKVGLIGCGQHAFSSIAYYLTTSSNAKICFALDTDKNASYSLAYAFNAVDIGENYYPNKSGIGIPDLVYISSNHASHTDYAVKYIKYGCDVFIEKPLSINICQFEKLKKIVDKGNVNIYTGYNRPHSKSIKIIRKKVDDNDLPFSLSCFVTAHYIDTNHWYRDPYEGTRIVANLGHWIDLSIHILFWAKTLPDYLDIVITYSDIETPSDNIIVSMVSSRHDLINLVLSSRSEPFEGVNETINFQQGELIAKIDDFRTTKIWQRNSYKKYFHWPKDNGHKSAILQPFNKDSKIREWPEIELSTRVMLLIEEMVKLNENQGRFEI